MVTVLAAVVAGALVFAATRNGRTGLADRFDTRAQLAADFTGTYLAQVAQREQRVAEEQLTGTVTPLRFSEVVTNNDFVASVLLDEDGDLLRVHPNTERIDASGFASRYEHLTDAVRGDVAVSDIVPSAARAEPIVAVAAPFYTAGGRRVFSSGFRITDTPLDVFIRGAVPIKGAAAYLVDGGGRVISSSRTGVVGEQLAAQEPTFARLPLQGAGTVDLDGERAHFVAKPIEDTAWRVVMTVPTATLYAPLHTSTILQVAALALLVVLAGLIALLARRLMRTERGLTEKVGELEAANGALDAFSHTLVHDLRNPLTVIGGLAQLLGDMLKDADERVRTMTGHIETSAERMSGLIEDVLALATVTRAAERTACDPRIVLAEAHGEYPNVELTVGWMPEALFVDRAGLYRTFQNLLENAATHGADAEGRVRVEVAIDENPWSWKLTVRDHGPGIAEADARRIFQAFERGVGAVPGTGTGLGLSIIGAFAQAHGGDATVANLADGGACFTVEIGKSAETPITTTDRSTLRA
ncbi:MAG: periplasmic sensor signal transduction histidine kinase [Thermoleophilia bacterium]|nr:periplasmic sensor signal transduction histidine kinase [Thermoleophilia bacterium]